MVLMLQKMSALDRKWLARILLKKLHLGIGDKRILELYDARAFDLYNNCNQLSLVCKAIDSKDETLLANNLIEIFRPVSAMLCERGYISKIKQVSSVILV